MVADGPRLSVYVDRAATPAIDVPDAAVTPGRFGVNVFDGLADLVTMLDVVERIAIWCPSFAQREDQPGEGHGPIPLVFRDACRRVRE